MPTTELLIFAKYPAPGDVMTRLCPPLTPDAAAAVQRACIRLLCERAFRSWPVRPKLVISPDDSEDAFRDFVGLYIPILPQGDGHLGERLARATKTAFDGGAESLLIIGSDSPTLPERLIRDAQTALTNSDAVIGPCDDGGFYLLGLNAAHDDLFLNIDWSSDKVAEQTTARVKACGMSIARLEPWFDIDRPEDLERAAKDIRDSGQFDAFELLRILDEVLTPAKTPKM